VVGLLTLTTIKIWMPDIETSENKKLVNVLKGLQNKELWALIALTTIGTGGFFAWFSYISPLVTEVAGLADSFVGYAMMLAGLGMVAGNFIGAKMANVFSPLKAVMISLVIMTMILVVNMFLASNSFSLMVLTFVIGAISFTVATPIQMAIINTSKGSEMLGSSMNQSAFNMGNASGAYLAGLPMAFGYGIIYSSLVGAALALSGVFIAIAIYMVRKIKAERYRKMIMNW